MSSKREEKMGGPVAISKEVIESFAPVRELPNHQDKSFIYSVDFDDKSKKILTSGSDNSLQVYNAMEGIHQQTVYSKKYGVSLAKFTHSSSNCVFGTTLLDSNMLCYHSLHDNSFLRYYKGHKAQITGIEVSPLDDTIITSSLLDHSLRLWDLRSPNCQGKLDILTPSPVAFDPSGKVFAVACERTAEVALYDVRHYDQDAFCVFSIDTNFLSRGTKDNYYRSLKFKEKEKNKNKNNPNHSHNSNKFLINENPISISCLEFSNDGSYLLVGTRSDNCHFILDAYNGLGKYSLMGHASLPPLNSIPATSNVCFTPDGRFVISSSANKRLCIWDTQFHQFSNLKVQDESILYPIKQLDCPSSYPNCLAFSPRTMELATADNKLTLWLPQYSNI